MPVSLPDAVVQRLKTARHVVVLTGGGMAAESGVPSFREAQHGAWAQYDVSDLATPQAFARNPRLVWEWYEHRRKAAEAVAPSAAHRALVDLEQHYAQWTLLTQTIDGLHWRAGSRKLIELNGCLRRCRCYEAGHVLSSWDDEGDLPPRCPHCGSVLRPDVVMFGEGLPESELRKARQAVEACDLFVCAGSVATIAPVSSFPFIARRAGAYVLTINADDDSIYAIMADHHLSTSPGAVLPEMVTLLREAGGAM